MNVDGNPKGKGTPAPFEVKLKPVPSRPNTPLPQVRELPADIAWSLWDAWQDTQVDDLK